MRKFRRTFIEIIYLSPTNIYEPEMGKKKQKKLIAPFNCNSPLCLLLVCVFFIRKNNRVIYTYKSLGKLMQLRYISWGFFVSVLKAHHLLGLIRLIPDC